MVTILPEATIAPSPIGGITSMVWSKTQQPLFISIYVRKSNTTLDERSRVINEIGEVIFNRYN